MAKHRLLAVATSVFAAGIVNALIYTLGYLVILIIQFALRGGDGASFGGAISSLIVTLLFTLLLSSIITFVLTFPIAVMCRWFGLTGVRSYIVAPAVGSAIACGIASLLDVALTTHIAIVSFAYITAATMWLMLGHSSGSPRTTQLAPAAG